MIIIKFNKKFSSLSPEQFISKIINKKTKCRYLYVSRNFKFGFKRRGNIKTLKKFEEEFNYKNIITNPFKKNKKTISSTIIRKKIRADQLEYDLDKQGYAGTPEKESRSKVNPIDNANRIRAGLKGGGSTCKLAKKGKGRAYGKNS